VERDILLGDADDLRLQDIFQIILDDLQRDRFGTLQNAEGGTIDARRLLIDLGTTTTAIEQTLRDGQADLGIVKSLVVLRQRSGAARIRLPRGSGPPAKSADWS
jgi:hypothetical protein